MSGDLSWARSSAMRRVATLVDRVADCGATVLVTGESGVGKEVVAGELHRRSARRDRPFVKVNCAALPHDLLESEMFGHERGAFTGADSATTGKFEAASRGTIMLDEIGEMPLALQAKLLHVLERGTFNKLGSHKELNPDVRVIAATNRSLAPMIADGLFREDLYYRLQVIEIFVPPLRERREEILPLAATFLQQFASKQGGVPVPALSSAILDALMRYEWPGNVRELENVIQRFVILRDERVLIQELGTPCVAVSEYASPTRGDAPAPVLGIPIPDAPVLRAGSPEQAAGPRESLPALVRRTTNRVEREVIAHALDAVRWNRRRAARMLGVSYKTLLNKMKTLGLDQSSHLQLATDN